MIYNRIKYEQQPNIEVHSFSILFPRTLIIAVSQLFVHNYDVIATFFHTFLKKILNLLTQCVCLFPLLKLESTGLCSVVSFFCFVLLFIFSLFSVMVLASVYQEAFMVYHLLNWCCPLNLNKYGLA